MADNKYVPIKVELDSSDTTDKVSKVNGVHCSSTVVIAHYEQIICGKVYTFNEGACAEKDVELMVSEALFYARTNVVRQITYVVSNTTADKICEIILIVNSGFYLFCQGLQLGVFFIFEIFCILKCGCNSGVFGAEIHNTLFAGSVAQKSFNYSYGSVSFLDGPHISQLFFMLVVNMDFPINYVNDIFQLTHGRIRGSKGLIVSAFNPGHQTEIDFRVRNIR